MKVRQLKQFLEDMDDNLEVCSAGSEDVADLKDMAIACLALDFNNSGIKTVVLIYQE